MNDGPPGTVRPIRLRTIGPFSSASKLRTLRPLPSFFAFFAASLLSPLVAAPADYLRDVKPLITQHCVRCHGAAKEEGGLRLDTAAAMRDGGSSGSIVRQPAGRESLLLQVITGTHEDIPAMPYKKPRLAEAEVATLRAWLAAGAPAPESEEPGRWEHWATRAS